MLHAITEDMATATAAAVSVRMLSSDGSRLNALTAHHPDPERGAAMAAVMGQTEQPSESGLWRTVIASHRPARWSIPQNGPPPREGSEAQVEFLRRHEIRAVMGVPLLIGDEFIGGLALVRYAVDRPFTDTDEELLVDCATRVAPLLQARRFVHDVV